MRYFRDERESFDAADVASTFLDGTFDALTYRAYASFAATDNVNLYVNVGDGYRSGGFNNPAYVAVGAPATFEPESVMSYEAGLKAILFDRRVSFDTALFYSKYQDMQDDTILIIDRGVPGPSEDDVAIGYTTNGQRGKLKGVEWDISWRATEELSLGLSGDVIDTEITRVTSGSPYDVGDPINFVPEYKLNASANYSFNWGASIPGFFRLDVSRQGKSIQTLRRALADPPQGIAPAVDFLNASLGANYNGWEVALFGRNLTDEDGIIRAAVTGQAAQARPRTVGITIGKRF